MSHTIETSASLRAPLRHRAYRILLTGSTISQSGDWLYNVALAVYVFDRTGSAGWVAAATVLRLLPYVVLAPIGGVVADRFDRRRVMICSDVLRAVSMGALAATAAANGPVLLVTLLAFATTAFGTAYQPAMMAVTPSVVGEDDLAAANALNTLVDNLTIVVGPALGAALLAVTSPVFAFSVNALTFVAPGAPFDLRPAPAGAPSERRRHGTGAHPIRGPFPRRGARGREVSGRSRSRRLLARCGLRVRRADRRARAGLRRAAGDGRPRLRLPARRPGCRRRDRRALREPARVRAAPGAHASHRARSRGAPDGRALRRSQPHRRDGAHGRVGSRRHRGRRARRDPAATSLAG